MNKTCKKCKLTEPLAKLVDDRWPEWACLHDWQEQEQQGFKIGDKIEIKCGPDESWEFFQNGTIKINKDPKTPIITANCEAYHINTDGTITLIKDSKMPIKFIVDEGQDPKELTFGMVEEDQFFIDDAQTLCQKINDSMYVSLTNCHGRPCSTINDTVSDKMPIERMLPRINKIEF